MLSRPASRSRSHTPSPYIDSLEQARSSRGQSVATSRLSPSPLVRGLPVIDEDDEELEVSHHTTGPRGLSKCARSPHAPSLTETPVSPRRKCSRAELAAANIIITRNLKVKLIQLLDEIPTSWTVPRVPTAYLVDASSLSLTMKSGEKQSIDAFIRSEVFSLS